MMMPRTHGQSFLVATAALEHLPQLEAAADLLDSLDVSMDDTDALRTVVDVLRRYARRIRREYDSRF